MRPSAIARKYRNTLHEVFHPTFPFNLSLPPQNFAFLCARRDKILVQFFSFLADLDYHASFIILLKLVSGKQSETRKKNPKKIVLSPLSLIHTSSLRHRGPRFELRSNRAGHLFHSVESISIIIYCHTGPFA